LGRPLCFRISTRPHSFGKAITGARHWQALSANPCLSADPAVLPADLLSLCVSGTLCEVSSLWSAVLWLLVSSVPLRLCVRYSVLPLEGVAEFSEHAAGLANDLFFAQIALEAGFTGEDAKIGVHRVKVFVAVIGNIPEQRADHGFWWKHHRLFSLKNAHGVHAGNQAGGGRFSVTFDTAELAGEEDARVILELQSRGEQFWRVDVRVAVHLPESDELCPF